MKQLLLTLTALVCALPLSAQIMLEGYNEKDVNPELLNNLHWQARWIARWIAPQGVSLNDYGIYHFRKKITLDTAPERFIVHVTADNRYKLFVNGKQVSLGPARCDIYNWNFATIDLAPHLKAGENTLAAVVWNFAQHKPIAQHTFRTGFMMQGNSEAEAAVNTDGTWLATKNEAYSPWYKSVYGYYAAGTCEMVDCSKYLWGWEKPGYDDSAWQKAALGWQGAPKGTCNYPERLLVPSPIPPMELTPIRFAAVREVEGLESTPAEFLKERTALTIPANSKVRILVDQGHLTTGYPTLEFSRGAGADIDITYAEALYEPGNKPGYPKGNRNEVEGKHMVGYQDRIIADGGENRSFTPLWWRTWRYIELMITTSDEPLVIEDLRADFSAYPFEPEYEFSAPGNEELSRMLEIGWRTARLCANETYMDCPYYEQLQYFGDTRVQAMVTMYNTHDEHMVKNALEQGRQSIALDGTMPMSRYPSSLHQYISSFSLWWILTGYDCWRYRGEEPYLKTLMPSFRGVLGWYEQYLKEDMSLNYIPHWFFLDWSAGLDFGEPIREKEGNSAIQDLQYLLALDAMAEMENMFGIEGMGRHYATIAAGIRKGFRAKYWDQERGLFADTHDCRSFSQHANTLAVLAGIVDGKEATEVMRRTLEGDGLIKATIYFRYYVHQALAKAGLGDLYIDNLQIWRDQMAIGLTTWAESPEPSRSDCHAWGASPNIELFRILLGIDSAAPGFEKVRIAPSLCGLKEVSGTMPHPKGSISAAYKVNDKGRLEAEITLPEGITGEFVWNGRSHKLHSGKQLLIVR